VTGKRTNPVEVMRKRYDEFAPTYVETWRKLEGYSGLVEEFLARRVREGDAVLDVGCGPGHLTAGLPSSVRVVGTDFAPAMLAKARAARPSGTYLLHDYYEPLPAGNGPFDVVLAVGALDFCEDLPLVLGHLARVCAPGARLLVNLIERRSGTPGHEGRRLPITPERMPGVDLVFYDLREMLDAFDSARLVPDRYVHYKGYHNQFHALDIEYALWELAAASG
jgi:SAM-dependent methyltransferase